MQNFNVLKISKHNNGVTFKVKVIPNSSTSKITEITEDYLKAKLNSPPIENKANKDVIILLAKTLDIPKTSITLISGDKNKLKTFLVPLSEEELRIKVRKIFE